MHGSVEFYAAVLNAGAILTGFCGTFLQFRIQREALYYRQPAVSFEKGEARDVFIGLSHFTSSFLLIIIAALLTVVFGLCCPMLALAKIEFKLNTVRPIIAGLLSALVFLGGYFCAELRHYGILNRRLLNDHKEWGRQRGVVAATVVIAGSLATLTCLEGSLDSVVSVFGSGAEWLRIWRK